MTKFLLSACLAVAFLSTHTTITRQAFGERADSAKRRSADKDALLDAFITPPDAAKPRVYWWWLFNRVDKAAIKEDLEEFKAKGISGVNLICTGGYAGKAPAT